MALRIDGKAHADRIVAALSARVAGLKAAGCVPHPAVVLVGDDPAGDINVRREVRRCAQAGIRSREHRLDRSTTESELLRSIDRSNIDPTVHGGLVRLPLRTGRRAAEILDGIDPAKDADGFHPVNVGRLSSGTGGLGPCTPLGVMRLLDAVIAEDRGLERDRDRHIQYRRQTRHHAAAGKRSYRNNACCRATTSAVVAAGSLLAVVPMRAPRRAALHAGERRSA